MSIWGEGITDLMWDIFGEPFQQTVSSLLEPVIQGAGAALGVETQLDADIALDEALAASSNTAAAIRDAGGVVNYFSQGATAEATEAVEMASMITESASQAGRVVGETLSSMLHDLPEVGGAGLAGTFNMNDPEDLTEVVNLLRNASTVPEVVETTTEVATFVPNFIRQGAEWAERQAVLLEDFAGPGQTMTNAFSGSGITAFDLEVFDNVVESAPQAVEMLVLRTVNLGQTSLAGTSIGLEAAGAIESAEEAVVAGLSALELTDLMEEKMEEAAMAIDGSIAIGEAVGGAAVEGALDAGLAVGETIGMFAGLSGEIALGAATEGIGLLPWYGIELIKKADKRYYRHHPKDKPDENRGALGYANKFWDWKETLGQTYKDEEGYLEQDATTSKVLWGQESLWLPITLLKSTDDDSIVTWTRLDGSQGTSYVANADGLRWLTPFPVKTLTDEQKKSYVPFVEMADGQQYVIPPNAPVWLYEDMPSLLTRDLSTVFWVWFRDNGVGQLPSLRAPPQNYSYIEHALPNTKLWRVAQAITVQKDPGYWIFLSTPQMFEDRRGFWFRVGIDGVLLKDSERTRNACLMENFANFKDFALNHKDSFSGQTPPTIEESLVQMQQDSTTTPEVDDFFQNSNWQNSTEGWGNDVWDDTTWVQNENFDQADSDQSYYPGDLVRYRWNGKDRGGQVSTIAPLTTVLQDAEKNVVREVLNTDILGVISETEFLMFGAKGSQTAADQTADTAADQLPDNQEELETKQYIHSAWPFLQMKNTAPDPPPLEQTGPEITDADSGFNQFRRLMGRPGEQGSVSDSEESAPLFGWQDRSEGEQRDKEGPKNMVRHFEDVAQNLFLLTETATSLLTHAEKMERDEPEGPKKGYWKQDIALLKSFNNEGKAGRGVIDSQAQSYMRMSEETATGKDRPPEFIKFEDFPDNLVDFVGDIEDIWDWFRGTKNIRAEAIEKAWSLQLRGTGGNSGLLIVGAILVLALVFYN